MRTPALCGAIILGLLLAICPGRSQTFLTLLTNGPTAKRINIVFLAEGYTNNQVTKFTNDAKVILNQLLNTIPFSDYREYYNAFAIFVASAETGSDHPSTSTYRDTYFNSTYDSYGITRLVTIPPNDLNSNYADGQGKVNALLQQFMPEYDLPFLVVNDTQYGGSGGQVIIDSVNSSSPEVGVHELGHTFAQLGDEYSDVYPGYPDTEEPNTTRETNRTSIKWSSWILDSTPIPTPAISTYYSVVGLFEGAHYQTTGWYRCHYS